MVAPKTNTQGVAPKPNQWKTPLPDTRDLEKAVNTVSVLIYGNKKLDYWYKKKTKKKNYTTEERSCVQDGNVPTWA